MKLFKKSKAASGRRPYVFFIAVIAVGLVCSLINGVTKRRAGDVRSDKPFLEAFDRWAEENVQDSILGRRIFKVEAISDYKCYVDERYVPAKKELEMLNGVKMFVRENDEEKKALIENAEKWLQAIIAARDTSVHGTPLAERIEAEKLDWYRRIANGGTEEEVRRLSAATDSVGGVVREIEDSEGYRIVFTCRVGDGEAYYVTFVAPKEKPDSLMFFGSAKE